MKLKSVFFTSLFALALNLSAQVTLDGFGEIIQTAVTNSFPPSTELTAVLGNIPTAIGPQGAVVTGRNTNGELIGNGLTASTTSSSNIDISSGILSTNVTWTTTISWKPVEGADGYLRIQITVTWGNSSESFTREINAPTRFPNEIFPYTTTTTSGTGSGSGASPGSGAGLGAGYYIPITIYGQYSYIDSAGTMHVVSYNYTVYIWVSDGSGGNQNEN